MADEEEGVDDPEAWVVEIFTSSRFISTFGLLRRPSYKWYVYRKKNANMIDRDHDGAPCSSRMFFSGLHRGDSRSARRAKWAAHRNIRYYNRRARRYQKQSDRESRERSYRRENVAKYEIGGEI